MREQRIKDIEKEFFEPSFQYLVENGFKNTSVRDLCKAMDLSPGSVYYWFEDKDDIYINVVRYGTGKVADKLFEFSYTSPQTGIAKKPPSFYGGFFNWSILQI